MMNVELSSELGSAPSALAAEMGIDPRPGSFSIREWCRYRGICPATFYNRRRYGEMPATLSIGRRRIITAEADKEWRLRMEQRGVPASISSSE
jgi:hypothetical protein